MLPTEEQKKFYEENGYLVIEKFLSDRECDELSQSAADVVKGHYANLLSLHDESDRFHKLIIHPGILKISDALQGARMIPIGSIFFFCKPGNPLENGSTAHQDNYSAKSPYGSYFVCGVALDDADPGNGSLVVYPKTHKLGDLPNVPSKNFEFNDKGQVVTAYPIGNEVIVPKGYEPIQLSYPRGSLIFIHGHVVHSAPKNMSPDRWRRKFYMHYIKDGDPFWPGWNAKRRLIERNDFDRPGTKPA